MHRTLRQAIRTFYIESKRRRPTRYGGSTGIHIRAVE